MIYDINRALESQEKYVVSKITPIQSDHVVRSFKRLYTVKSDVLDMPKRSLKALHAIVAEL